MKQGYLGIFRKFFDEHEFWKEKRKYSKAEAWIDLMQSARYGEEPETLFDKRGSYVLEYGDVYISLRYLGERWQWSKNKVNSFLQYLEKRESILAKKRDSHRTIINITNLKGYTEWIKGKRDSEGTVKGQSRDSEGTKKKKVNKEKKVNSKTSIPKDFSITERVKQWADKKGHTSLDEHLENFILKSNAKEYKYVDWDSAFMGAIRDNWAKIDSQTKEPYRTMTGVNGEEVELHSQEEVDSHKALLAKHATERTGPA